MSDLSVPFAEPEEYGIDKLSRRAQVRILEAEVAALKKALAEPMDDERWGQHAPQALRDQYAASALISSQLHPLRALSRLGFRIAPTEPGQPQDPKWRVRFTARPDKVQARPHKVQAVDNRHAWFSNEPALAGNYIPRPIFCSTNKSKDSSPLGYFRRRRSGMRMEPKVS